MVSDHGAGPVGQRLQQQEERAQKERDADHHRHRKVPGAPAHFHQHDRLPGLLGDEPEKATEIDERKRERQTIAPATEPWAHHVIQKSDADVVAALERIGAAEEKAGGAHHDGGVVHPDRGGSKQPVHQHLEAGQRRRDQEQPGKAVADRTGQAVDFF